MLVCCTEPDDDGAISSIASLYYSLLNSEDSGGSRVAPPTLSCLMSFGKCLESLVQRLVDQNDKCLISVNVSRSNQKMHIYTHLKL